MDHRKETMFEDVYFINTRTGEVGAETTDYDKEGEVKYNDQTREVLNRNDGQTYISIHNHPRSTPPSLVDLNGLYARRGKEIGAVIIGFDGSIYYYENRHSFIEKSDYNAAREAYKEVRDEVAQQWMALASLNKKYKFKVVKIR